MARTKRFVELSIFLYLWYVTKMSIHSVTLHCATEFLMNAKISFY